MKNLSFILTLILALTLFSGLHAQNRARIEAASSLTFYGLDFSRARMIGSKKDFPDASRIVSGLFGEWNRLFFKEPKKYDLGAAFNKRIDLDTTIVTRVNAKVDFSRLVSEIPNSLSIQDTREVVKQYAGDAGIGLLFMVENFDKPGRKVRFWVVLFDITTHDVLMAKQSVTEMTGGIGFKNFWASALYTGIKNVRAQYPKWLKTIN